MTNEEAIALLEDQMNFNRTMQRGWGNTMIETDAGNIVDGALYANQHKDVADALELAINALRAGGKGMNVPSYDLDRLRELVEADRDGRCGIPPVKLHQTIYRVFDGKIIKETVCKAIWEPFIPRPRWKVWIMGSGLPYYWNDCIGKTVFLTREAAEAAMKGCEHQ